mgnify:FL=1
MMRFIEDHRLKTAVDANIEKIEDEPPTAPREHNSNADNAAQDDDIFAPRMILNVWHEITTCYSMSSINQNARDTDELLSLPLFIYILDRSI